MNRLLLLLALLSLVASQHHCNHNKSRGSRWRQCHLHKPPRGPPRRPDKYFNSMAEEIIRNDLKLQEFCNKFPKDGVKEIYEADAYKLIYPLQDYVEESIDIKVKHRLLYFSAERKSSTGRNKVDLTVLPEIVNATQAEWYIEDERIEIWMPFKIVFNKEQDKTCDGEINNEQTIVPRFDHNVDLRMGHEYALKVKIPITITGDIKNNENIDVNLMNETLDPINETTSEPIYAIDPVAEISDSPDHDDTTIETVDDMTAHVTENPDISFDDQDTLSEIIEDTTTITEIIDSPAPENDTSTINENSDNNRADISKDSQV